MKMKLMRHASVSKLTSLCSYQQSTAAARLTPATTSRILLLLRVPLSSISMLVKSRSLLACRNLPCGRRHICRRRSVMLHAASARYVFSQAGRSYLCVIQSDRPDWELSSKSATNSSQQPNLLGESAGSSSRSHLVSRAPTSQVKNRSLLP